MHHGRQPPTCCLCSCAGGRGSAPRAAFCGAPRRATCLRWGCAPARRPSVGHWEACTCTARTLHTLHTGVVASGEGWWVASGARPASSASTGRERDARPRRPERIEGVHMNRVLDMTCACTCTCTVCVWKDSMDTCKTTAYAWTRGSHARLRVPGRWTAAQTG